MNIFDIIGPVMVGPSSSHTAGAAKIGSAARRLLGEPVARAEILLYGSLLATGRGHGTDRAIVAGLLGMGPDDERIPRSLELAQAQGMEVTFGAADLKDAHVNSVLLRLTGRSGKTMEVVGQSLGGSVINIQSINGVEANFSGESPTLIVFNEDRPGLISGITSMLASIGINIATMHVSRTNRGGTAATVIECDQEIPFGAKNMLQIVDGIDRVIYFSPREEAPHEL